ncbi:8007_t:CDS:2, partial [Rhizophagus irregularis]
STSSTSGMDEPPQTDEQTVAKPEPVVNSNPEPSQTPEKDHKLHSGMSPDELASKLLELLTDRVKRVQNREGAKQLLKWIQDAISSGQLKDPGTPGCPVVTHGATNLSNAITIASEALRHCPRNNTSPAQNYAIVNYRRRGVPYVQAKPIKLFDKN